MPPSSPRGAPINDRTTHAAHDLEAHARRRVGLRLGFYVHAAVFVLVKLGLFAIDGLGGSARWSHWPLMGWGLGLAIHGVVTLAALRGDGLRDRMVADEVERLRRR